MTDSSEPSHSPSAMQDPASGEARSADQNGEINGKASSDSSETTGVPAELPSPPSSLVLGGIDAPQFSVPPFAPRSRNGSSTDQRSGAGSSPSPSIGDSLSEDVDSYESLGDGSAGGDGESPTRYEERLNPLDKIEAQIDLDLIDEHASRVASGSSLASGATDRVVEMLLRRDLVDEGQVEVAQERRQKQHPDVALWRVVAEQEGVDKETVYERAARIYAFKVVDLENSSYSSDFIRSAVERFPEERQEQLLDLGVIPLRKDTGSETHAGTVHFITHDPMRPEVHRAVRSLGLEEFELQYAPESSVDRIISEVFPRRDNEYLERFNEESALDLGQNFQEDEEEELVDQERLEEQISRSTLINLFEATLVEAVREGASDIHIFPNEKERVEIHFRINGRLNHWHTEDRVHPEALLSVVKDNSMNVDRFESDAAQDGFIQRDVDGARIRFRVSVMPVASANQELDSESVVIRVLDDRKVITDLNELGLGQRALDRFEHAINQPYGMVILTGPTGSGKSTTLVAALHRVMGPEENVLTIEDPVEYVIEGARQIKLSDKLQLEDALRSVLRHDPDTVMVGEMRDKVTAELAIKLANTGHLTFSTLHTNDAPSAVSRLYKMDIEPFLIAYAINLVVAQRLLRTLCPLCKREDPDPDPVLLRQLGFTEKEIQNGTFFTVDADPDCKQCGGTGYDGRRAIAEALHFSQEIRHMIVEAEGMVDEGEIREHAQKEDGMRSLQASAREAVLNGETTIDEMMRVVST